MPYIYQHQRTDIHGEEHQNALVSLAHFLNTPEHVAKKVQWTLQVLQYWVLTSYKISDVRANVPIFDPLTEPSKKAQQLTEGICLNISKIAQAHGGLDGLLNYTITRFFNEVFVAPRYKDYNDMIGMLESMKKMIPETSIDALGMLTCCQMEYYRKYAAPYEDLKESENGLVVRPQKQSSSY